MSPGLGVQPTVLDGRAGCCYHLQNAHGAPRIAHDIPALHMTCRTVVLVLSAIAFNTASLGRSQPADEQTRMGQIERERRAKEQKLSPPQPDRLEAAVNRIEDNAVVKRLLGANGGVGIRLGGLVTGSGFALGPSYVRSDLLQENVRLELSAAGSLKRYYSLDARVSMPRLLSKRLSVDVYAKHSDAPQIAYFGPGADSSKDGRTSFRREDTIGAARVGVRLHRLFMFGLTGGLNAINVGPGTSKVYASTDKVYSDAQARGINLQSRYSDWGPFVQFDTRDRKADPHRGTNFVTRYVWVNDSRDIYTYKALQASLEQYIPILNEKRVFAIRGRVDLRYTSDGNRVPFYLQPTLGGSDDLRGFRQFRFYDDNVFFMNGEYRWEVAPAFDMALFVDAGKVFPKPGDISLSGFEKAGGFGLRFKTRTAVVFRLDTGFSREGFQIWFKFNPPFEGLFHGIF